MASHLPNRSLLLMSVAAAAVTFAVATLWLIGDGLQPIPGAISSADAPATPTSKPVSALAPDDRTAVAATSGYWTAPAGSHFAFALDDRCDIAVHSPEGGTQQGAVLHSRCRIDTLVLDHRDGQILVQQQLSDLEFLLPDGSRIADDPQQQRFTAAASAPVLMRIDAAGRVLGYGFGDELDGDQRNFLRGTLSLLACEAPVAGNQVWESSGHDTTGEFTARHRVLADAANGADAAVVERTRLRYIKMVGQPDVPEHRLDGAVQVRFARDRGWIDQVRADEQLEMALSLLDLRALSRRRANVDLVAADTAPLPSLDEVRAAWQNASASPTSVGERLGAGAAANEREAWRQRLNGVSLDQLLAAVRQLLASGQVDAEALDGQFQQLQWLLKLQPQAITELTNQLRSGAHDEATSRVALGALGAAGTSEAQQALALFCFDAGTAVTLRQSATIACLQLGEPDAAILDGLLQASRGDAELRGTSLLVYGALSPRSGAPTADGASRIDALLAMEAEAEARGELDTWLLAVANADTPATESIAQRLLGHATPAVRAAACVALGKIHGGGALQALIERGLGDQDPAVRHEAVLALARRSEPAARTAVETVAQQDADVGVRERARRLLQGA